MNENLGNQLQGLGAWMAGDGVRYENMRVFDRDQKQRAELAARQQRQRISDSERKQLADLGRGIAGGLATAAQQGPTQLAAVIPSALEQARGTPWEPAVLETAERLQSGNFEDLQQELLFEANALGAGLDTNRGYQAGASVRYTGEDGNSYIGRPITNSATGVTTFEPLRIPGTPSDSRGLTSDDRVTEAERKTAAQEEAKSGEALYVDIRDRGINAAYVMPNIKRSLEILDDIRTSGFKAAQIRAKQFFGIESADEASLQNLLGKAVLSQLKATFGAQFTDAEGKRLERMEANLGRSSAGNRRILSDLMKMNQTMIDRAMKAATTKKDQLAIEEMQTYLNMELSPRQEQPAAEVPKIKILGIK